MDSVREQRVCMGEALWSQFCALAARLGLDSQQALGAAMKQWMNTDHTGRCPSCGAKLCHPTSEHHESWCPELEALSIDDVKELYARRARRASGSPAPAHHDGEEPGRPLLKAVLLH